MKRRLLCIGGIIVIIVMIGLASILFMKREISSEKLVLSVSEDENRNVLLNSNIEFSDYDYCVINYSEADVTKTIVFLKLYDNFHLRHFNNPGTAEYQMVLFYNGADAEGSESYSIEDLDGIYYLVDSYADYADLTYQEILTKINDSTVIWEKQ